MPKKDKPKLTIDEYREKKVREEKRLFKTNLPWQIQIPITIPIIFFITLVILYLTYIKELGTP